MATERPTADELLARVTEQDRKRTRGRLKVFFGSSPGVGKTYAMLEAAQAARNSGADVVVGLVETHRRAETEALLTGLETLARRPIAHRGVTLSEFDLDAALARRPELLLVDELAHTNAPGSRHLKRWQDILELLEAGINVYTTLNVQHVESLNDVVAQVTGVTVRETVPDSVLDEADEIALVDLPVEELRARMREGKVYMPEQAGRAMESFFRSGNLIALREMALRRTADRVDAQMRIYRRDHAIESTWPVSDRMLVCIGPSPFSAKLIRASKRMAERLNAEWIVAFVETGSYATLPVATRERVLASLRLAAQLGAETVTLNGQNVAETVLRYARSKNVSKIVVGKQAGPVWKRILHGSVLDSLVDASGDIDVYAISGEAGSPLSTPVERNVIPVPWHDYAAATAIISVCALASVALRSILDPANLAMLYLLGVVGVAMRFTRRVATFASVMSVVAFDLLCVPPYLSLAISDYQHVVTFAVMFTVGMIISSLTVRIRMQAGHAVDREGRTQALYRLAKELTGQTRLFDTARVASEIAKEVFGTRVVIFLPDDQERISFSHRTTDELPLPRQEEGTAQWVFDHGRRAGATTDTLPDAKALYLPLRGSRGVTGVMAVLNDDLDLSPERQHLLEIFASQTALAMERVAAAASTREAELRVQAEQMRSSLLSAVSHDLQTPLASITGAATSLLTQGEQMEPKTRSELLQSVADEAKRLSRLVSNLLEMTRLDSGAVEVRRDWHPLEEIIGAALNRLELALEGRAVHIDLPRNLPMISVDDVLMEHVFTNLLENSAKYSPAGSPVDIVARKQDASVMIEVMDRGPGFIPGDEKRVFGKFYRGSVEGIRGAGLGLAICQAIVTAHRGAIVAENRPGGGATIRIILPVGGTPPEVPADA